MFSRYKEKETDINILILHINQKLKELEKIRKEYGQGRFSERLKSMRNSRINTQLSQYSDQALSNLEKGIQDELTALKESRQAYFGTLNATN